MTQEENKIVKFKRGNCPTCGKLADEKYRPFCSKRCADLDLGNWLNEGYRLPCEENAFEEDMEY